MIDLRLRTRVLRDGEMGRGTVVYWMSRDQRAQDNWALLYAQHLALELKRPLVVAFYLADQFLAAAWRHFHFMLQGLAETEQALRRRRIPLVVLTGDLESAWLRLRGRLPMAALVTDFDPVRLKRDWRGRVARALAIPVYEVDAHNIVPCWLASDHAETGARTLRPKLNRLLAQYLVPFPELADHPFSLPAPFPPVAWDAMERYLRVDRRIGPVAGIAPGPKAGAARLRDFLRSGLAGYPEDRNNPLRDGQSGLSPYLHFGQLSAQNAALAAAIPPVPTESRETFLEELIVRRELADNFCYYHEDYDQVSAFPAWAQATLQAHAADPRPHLVSRERLEKADSPDELWNAAQIKCLSPARCTVT